MKMKILMVAGCVTLFSAGFFSCKKDSNTSSSNAQFTMHLTDAPAYYDAVNIDIQQIGFTMTGKSEVMITPNRAGVYNILKFKNGVDTLLSSISLPAGTVGQIRLVLGSNNSVVVAGVSYPLNTPSAQESGLKLNLNQTFVANGSYDIWFDFDAAKSIVETGSGSYKLKPTIRAYSATTNGKVSGTVLPTIAFATVYAVNGSDTSSAIPAADGSFVISGLASGTYQLIYSPAVSTYLSYSTSVNVTYGSITSAGTVTLHP
jgi:sRNA-binding regulator protein Hfq